VVGTKYNTTGNWFLWLNEDTPDASLGYLKTAYSRAYKTADLGHVQAVATIDCAGNALPDVIVGTKNPSTAGRGIIEVWQNGEGATPAFTRVETYPTAGGLATNSLGEVRAMTLADLDGDGRRDLIVGTNKATSTTTYSGQVIVFKNVSKTTGSRFIQKFNFYLPTDAVNSLAVGDFDADGWPDIAAGTQWKDDKGRLMIIRNQQAPVELVRAGPAAVTPVTMNLAMVDSVECQGIVLSVAAADMGGASNADVIVGWREKSSTYLGGALIYYMDGFYSLGGSGRVRLSTSPTDPSGGSLKSVVSTMTVNNFNYGVNPSVPYPPYLVDVALGVKLTATTGQIMILQR
jgi:hypothetical protein